MSRGVALGSLFVGVVALLCALASLAWILISHLGEEGVKEEMLQRLQDLEEKHEDEGRMGRQMQIQRPAFCSLRLDPGPCRSQVYRWYFLPKESDCLQFPWGGCKGNDNNFMSLAQCRAACLVPLDQTPAPHLASTPHRLSTPRRTQTDKSTQVEMFDKSECDKQPDSGPCQDRISRFYYDQGECKRFEYGGCAGNLNNFFSSNECRRKCLSVEDVRVRGAATGTRHRPPPVVDTCNLEVDLGDCQDTVERFHWDREKRVCVSFMWTGCGGNSNNFFTRGKCRKRCSGSSGSK